MIKSFKDFVVLKEADTSTDWRKSFIRLEKGFIPPPKMRPVIEAFLKSGEIQLTKDVGKAPTMPKKSLFLVGGPVRDFLKNKSAKDFDLATNATPEQTAHILSASGFKMAEDRSGKKGKSLDLTFTPEEAGPQGEKRYWFIKGRDASQDGKPFVISAVVDGEEFEIATFRKDAKVTDGAAEVDFVDNPHDDASRRDLTINSMYIELTKADGENNKLFDPTGKGWHDISHNIVRTVGKSEERFGEDKLRVLRAIRFHSRFGSGEKMDDDIEKALPKFKHLDGVALERIRDEFLKGLLHPDVDSKVYINILRRTGLLAKIFPGISFDVPEGMPLHIADKKDKPLALAWLLQHNTSDRVAEALSPNREDKQTGWTVQERRSVLYLLKLKEFSPDHLSEFMKTRAGTGLSDQQIRDWVELFKIPNTNRNRRPWWAKQVTQFSVHKPSVRWDQVQAEGKDKCPACRGGGCTECHFQGKVPENMRSKIIGDMEVERFKASLK